VPNNLGLNQGEAKETFLEAMKAFDYKGSILLSSSLTFLILGLVSTSTSKHWFYLPAHLSQNIGGNVLPWHHPFVLASLSIFGASFPSFMWIESRVSRPIMPLSIICQSPRANIIFSNALGAMVTNGNMHPYLFETKS
jgi:hypothetical protein